MPEKKFFLCCFDLCIERTLPTKVTTDKTEHIDEVISTKFELSHNFFMGENNMLWICECFTIICCQNVKTVHFLTPEETRLNVW